MNVKWIYKYFTELTSQELYKIIELRNEVFVVEQNCVYQDADNKDQQAYHLMGFINNDLVAYSRILPVGIAYETYCSIGRVVSSPKYRGTGVGKLLISEAIERTYKQFDTKKIKIGAQLYLKKFYESFGFIQCGEEYLEDNIPHMPMLHQKIVIK